ncbi:MAG: TlpA disulfide reductase family protein [Anaerolineales bacterium]
MSRRARPQKPNPNIALAVVGAGLILISIAAAFAIPQAQAAVRENEIGVTPVEVNFAAPDVQLTDLQGNPVALSDYRGNVILYNAWATWCPPCKAEMPVLQAYYEKYKNQGFVVIAIEDGQPLEEVAAFAQTYKLTFLVWPDLEWRATKAWDIQALPTSYVIDRHGTARLTWSGEATLTMLEKYVTPLILGQ